MFIYVVALCLVLCRVQSCCCNSKMKATLKYLAGVAGPSGYGSNSTADQVTHHHCSCLFPSHLTAIITGATSGIGAETARVLAKRGVRVVIPARDLTKAAKVKESIKRESPEAEILLMEINLSSLASVKRFCCEFLSLGLPLNIIINNAGKFSSKLEFSEEKVEMTCASNYLGHFLLTEMLMEKMVKTAKETGVEGRIVNVSSAVHTWVKKGTFSFNKMRKPINFSGTRSYAQTKFASILHAKEISRQLQERDARVTINVVHPGIIKTGIVRDHKGLVTDSLFFIASKLLKSIAQGAATTCYVALSTQIEGVTGRYFADCNEGRCSSFANDELEAQKLWKQTRNFVCRRLCQQPATSKEQQTATAHSFS